MAASISAEELERLAKRITYLDRQSEHLRSWLYGWTALVALGLVLEYRKEFIRLAEYLWAYTFGRVPFEWWRIRMILVAIGAGTLVTVGVMGELGVEFRQSDLESELATTNGKLTGDLGELSKEAADNAKAALRDAGGAVTRVDIIAPQLQAAETTSSRALGISGRAETAASKAMTLANGALQKAEDATAKEDSLAKELGIVDRSVKRRRPRDVLLGEAGHIGLDPRLTEFKGQRVRILLCAGTGEEIAEEQRTARKLFSELGVIAKWMPMLYPVRCLSNPGMDILVSPGAIPSTRRAADALLHVLYDIGLPFRADPPVILDTATLPNGDPHDLVVVTLEFRPGP